VGGEDMLPGLELRQGKKILVESDPSDVALLLSLSGTPPLADKQFPREPSCAVSGKLYMEVETTP